MTRMSSVSRITAGMAASLVAAAAAGGCQHAPAPMADEDPTAAPMATTRAQARRPAGVPVPGTQVVVPRHAVAGGTLRINAPPGSLAGFGHARLEVPASGELLLDVPSAPGAAQLVIERPDGRRLSFRVRID